MMVREGSRQISWSKRGIIAIRKDVLIQVSEFILTCVGLPMRERSRFE